MDFQHHSVELTNISSFAMICLAFMLLISQKFD